MDYTSTRNAARRVHGAQAILTGLSPDGGLFVPVECGKIDIPALMDKSYVDIAAAVFAHFLPEYKEHYLRGALEDSYSDNFGGKAGYLAKIEDGLYSLELWHGPTAAFKDYALQIMPKLFSQARQMMNVGETTLILVATSGDTGSAALNGYRDLEGVKIAAFYPENGTSEIQRLQMVTQQGGNVCAFGIRGNFDDAQRGVKAAFSNAALAEELKKKNTRLSSANSINWGRLCPQIVYYISSYLALCRQGAISYGQPVDYCVPTGNFGDIMAGWYAKRLGLPVGRLVCASNKNNVLADFFATGHYNARREFYQTSSPSMDILVSSNLERLLFHESEDALGVRGYMEQLAKTGEYTVDKDVMERIRATFCAGWAGEDEVEGVIGRMFREKGYLCDPHTAVALGVAEKTLGGERPVVALSTASPFKFSAKVLSALGQAVPADEFEAMAKLEQCSGQKAPVSLAGLKGRPVRFARVIDPAQIETVPLEL